MYKAKIIPYAADGQEWLCSLQKVRKTVSTKLITTFSPARMVGTFNCWNAADRNVGNPWLKGTAAWGLLHSYSFWASHISFALVANVGIHGFFVIRFDHWNCLALFFFLMTEMVNAYFWGTIWCHSWRLKEEEAREDFLNVWPGFTLELPSNSAANSVSQRVWAACCCYNKRP